MATPDIELVYGPEVATNSPSEPVFVGRKSEMLRGVEAEGCESWSLILGDNISSTEVCSRHELLELCR